MTRGRARAVVAAVMVVGAGAVTGAACFSPHPASGLPCTPDDECPGGLVCDTTQQPAVCVEDPAARIDAAPPVTPDAPPLISCDDADPDPCPAEVPVCDDGTCRGCVADSECGSGACLELDGTCPALDAILFVAPLSSGTACSRNQPCAVATAVQSLDADRYVIRLGPGTYPSVTVAFVDTAAATVYLSGPDRSWDGATLVPGMTSLRIRDGARVVMEGFSVVDSSYDGINITNATLVAERLWLYGAKQAGIDASDAEVSLREVFVEDSETHGLVMSDVDLDVDRSYLVENGAAGVYAENSTVRVTNTALLANGLGTEALPALQLVNVSSISVIAYNTFASNTARAIDCVASSPTITSSIFASNPEPQVGDACDVVHSLFSGPAPSGNTTGDPMFLSSTDFKVEIGPGSPARGLGEPVAGVTADIDGEPRPQGGYDAGADEVP